ncbi:MAG: hypothetical protein LLG01_19510 [Planctomycetaceae bacterium]|nr:hypothetical protein [Planctomycetaceae bacterium]
MRHVITAVAAVLICAMPLCAQAQSAPASRLAVDRSAKDIEQLIADIRSAPDLNTAAADYAEGRNINRNSIPLYEAYIQRMLDLGQPRIAVYPATELARLKPADGLAWAVLAYNDAAQGRYFQALQEVLPAMKHRPDDKTIQHNAANLVAWYEGSQPRPPLPNELARILDQSLEGWKQLPQFAATYAKARQTYTGRAKRSQELAQQIAAAKIRAQGVLAEARDIDSIAARNDAQIRDQWALISQYRYRLSRIEADLAIEPDPGNRLLLRRSADDVRADIARALQSITDRQQETNTIALRKRDLVEALTRINAEIDRLKAEEKAIGPVAPAFSWHAPVGNAKAPAAAPAPVGAPPAPAAPPAPEALRLLDMARLLRANGFADKADETLRDIIKRFPNTAPALEAKDLLGQNPASAPGK